ncbi:MAG: hypothetical protein J5651_00420 [Salinivirgaceae bacterium]|nr:hypothetical protein [Salinivirgaceae bacterium]
MKTKDLMIGNYVTDQKGKPVRVASINSKGITYGNGNMMHFLSDKEMGELPLTTTIVEKNGDIFLRSDNGSYVIDGVADLRLQISGQMWHIGLITFESGTQHFLPFYSFTSVHQLQNALGLLNIDKEIEL